MFQIKLLSEFAVCPVRSTPGSAGYDLFSAEDSFVSSLGGQKLIKTDIAISIPKKTYGRIAPRSGMAMKGIGVMAGVIDSDYRGPVGVILINHSMTPYIIKKGDRIAQLILEKIETPEISIVDELTDTKRQNGGFGSTGK